MCAQRGAGRYSSKGEEGKGGGRGGGGGGRPGHPSQKISLIGLMDDVRTKSKAPLAGVALTRPAAAAKPPASPPAPQQRRARAPAPPSPPSIPEGGVPPGMHLMLQQAPLPYWAEYGAYGSSVPVTASPAPPQALQPRQPPPTSQALYAPAEQQQLAPKVASLFVAAPVSVVSPFSAGKHFPRHTLPNIYEVPAAAAGGPSSKAAAARTPKGL
jgi:hypothetical protein